MAAGSFAVLLLLLLECTYLDLLKAAATRPALTLPAATLPARLRRR